MPTEIQFPCPRRTLLRGAMNVALGLAAGSPLFAEGAAPGRWNLSGDGPHLIVHYMPWFAVTPSARDTTALWDHWKSNDPKAMHDPEKRLPDGQRDIASVYYPLIGPYSTWNPNVLRYHMETIRAMGGAAVILDWYAPGHFTDTQVPAILDAAQKAGLKVALCYEEKINFIWPERRDPKTRAEAVALATGDLNYALKHYASHPAYLRRNGRPFFTQFNGWGQGALGPKFFTPEEDQKILGDLTEPICFGRQGLEPAYDATADCRYLWWSADTGAIRKFASDARGMVDRGQAKFFMNFVSPGFDDTGVWGWGNKPRVTPRNGLAFLHGTLENALADGPELVQVVTWNDFQEGTVFEPTREFGFWYVDALATGWAQRTGRPAPDLDALRAPFRRYVANASPTEHAELPPSPYDSYLAKRGG